MQLFHHDSAPPETQRSESRPATQEASAFPSTEPVAGGRATSNGDAMSRLSAAISEASLDSRFEGLRKLARDLAKEDPLHALEVGLKIPDGNDRIEFLRAAFAEWAVRDPAAALARGKQFPAGELRNETLNAALGTWAGRDPRGALVWSDSNISGPLKEESFVTIAMSWARREPETAGAWFIANGSTSQAVINGLVSTWADLDPRSAARGRPCAALQAHHGKPVTGRSSQGRQSLRRADSLGPIGRDGCLARSRNGETSCHG